ncbi:MAG: sigma-70 family RNA polymerase sigma factor [Abditibacteriaceae bacterium]
MQQHHDVFENNFDALPAVTNIPKYRSMQEDFSETDALKLWWKHVMQCPLLTPEREIELAKRVEAGDQSAFQEMVESNLRLVANIARKSRRFAGHILSLEDLIQEGCVGLMRAVQKFDYRRGYKFSTYASYWIRQSIFRSVADNGRNIRLPVHMVESISRTDRARSVLTQQLHRPPSNCELSAYLSISEKKVQDIVDCVSDPVSLDITVSEEEDVTLLDLVVDIQTQTVVEQTSFIALRGELAQALGTLSDREAKVLSLHFGLNGDAPLTLFEVGERMGLTRERIRQIEKNALRQLKAIPSLVETAATAKDIAKMERKAKAA